MKKKILIFSHAMEIGGAERALLGLLETIDTTRYEVDLFLVRHTGELMQYIPQNVHLLPEMREYSCLAVPISNVIRQHQFGVAVGRFRGKRAAAKRIKRLNFLGENDVALEYSHKYTVNRMPDISNVEYDLAISFLTPHYFVAHKVNAKKRIAWIHTDYAAIEVDRDSQIQMWSPYDVIASISDAVTKSFVQIFPELESKVQLIPNIMPKRYLFTLAEAFHPSEEMRDDGSVKILSVGRFCTAKNFDNVPDLCRRIRNGGLDVQWYLIGYGSDEQLIRQKISESNMEEYVHILGKKENPYPYIKACDLYVQPSRYEGKCVSVVEAQMLHKPVVITNYATSSSQLTDGYDGVIVPMDNKGCAEGIARVLKDIELQHRIIENMRQCDYTNAAEIEKIDKVLEAVR